jgi:adenosine deaminase
MSADPIARLTRFLTQLISETSGLSLEDTLALAQQSPLMLEDAELAEAIRDFRERLGRFRLNAAQIETLFEHPVSRALEAFLRAFPIPYRDEHIHLTGSLDAEFIYPRLMQLLDGPNRAMYESKIAQVYGVAPPPSAANGRAAEGGGATLPIRSAADVNRLIRIGDDDRFDRYLKILYLPKLILTSREAHRDAAYHMASRLYRTANVGALRLKFTLFRETTDPTEKVPIDLSPEDVLLGLYEGFRSFQSEMPSFKFILSPSFRKEPSFYERMSFDDQVRQIVELLKRHPELQDVVTEVDTVGDERGFYRKVHFQQMRVGMRKLQAYGLRTRSHHGETWNTLRQGIQAVDNAMNIWHVDAIEHGLSLGINPNFYFHSLLQRILRANLRGEAPGAREQMEIADMDWSGREAIRDKLLRGEPLAADESTLATKTKFHHAREVEHYQHDVLNRMIDKRLTLVSLPSSNKKLTGALTDYNDHPFSWWEKKGLRLGVGTDNDITLNTSFIREMLILLFTDPLELKITKLLIVTTGESRRDYLSHMLWQMRKATASDPSPPRIAGEKVPKADEGAVPQ